MAKGMGVLIQVGKPKAAPPDDPDEMPMHGGLSKRNDAQEKPADEDRVHKQGGAPAATPESVSYRTSAETCANCEYMAGDQCSFLSMPVSGGDSCARFENRADDVIDHGPAEQSLQSPGGY